MVGRFTLPSLPSLPAALADLLDTSPQVFYPPSRPTSRQSFSARRQSLSAPAPAGSCPPSPRRTPTFDEGGLPPLPPPQFWGPAAHPHTDAPLGHARSQSTYSLASYATPQQSFPQPLAELPPRGSSLISEPPWQLGGGGSSASTTPKRPSHKRSQSAAPGSFHAPTLARLEARSSTAAASRQLVSNTSASSLPTLAEDSGPSLLERSASDRERRQQQSWFEPPPPPPRPRRRAQSSVTLVTTPRSTGTFVEPALPDRLRRHRHSCIITSSTATVALSSTPPAPPSALPTAPSTPRTGHSRRSSVCSEAGRASPSVATASVSVSDIAAVATWSQEPLTPSRLSRSNSMAAGSPSESLRQRLRSLSELDQPPVTPTKRHSLVLSPATPRSTHGTPGHGTSGTPGSCTPTSNSHCSAPPPQSPTPRRTARPSSLHRHSISLQFPDERDRPTTTRLRQPTRMSMGPVDAPRSRRQSMLEAPSPLLVATPMLGSSPGSLLSDSGSSPTTSIESLPLGPAMRVRRSSEQHEVRHMKPQSKDPSKENKRASWHERRRSVQSTHSVYSYTTYSDQTHSTSRYMPFPQPHPHAPSYAQAASGEWRRPGVTVSVMDDMEGERFLDFDDI